MATEIRREGEYYPTNYLQLDKDPSGKNLKEPGTKGDLGKSPVTRGCLHYFPRALLEVAKLSQFGANKYSWKGWESVPDGIHRYSDAIGRHELAIQDNFERLDPETGIMEATAVAWNALARLELIKRKQEEIKNHVGLGIAGGAVLGQCDSSILAVLSQDQTIGVVGKPQC